MVHFIILVLYELQIEALKLWDLSFFGISQIYKIWHCFLHGIPNMIYKFFIIPSSKTQRLIFICSCERITDRGLELLASGMSGYLPHIRSLQLHFLRYSFELFKLITWSSFSKITDTGVETFLVKAGKFFGTLERFGLHFAW